MHRRRTNSDGGGGGKIKLTSPLNFLRNVILSKAIMVRSFAFLFATKCSVRGTIGLLESLRIKRGHKKIATDGVRTIYLELPIYR